MHFHHTTGSKHDSCTAALADASHVTGSRCFQTIGSHVDHVIRSENSFYEHTFGNTFCESHAYNE